MQLNTCHLPLPHSTPLIRKPPNTHYEPVIGNPSNKARHNRRHTPRTLYSFRHPLSLAHTSAWTKSRMHSARSVFRTTSPRR
jgi:hypothetical protein